MVSFANFGPEAAQFLDKLFFALGRAGVIFNVNKLHYFVLFWNSPCENGRLALI